MEGERWGGEKKVKGVGMEGEDGVEEGQGGCGWNREDGVEKDRGGLGVRVRRRARVVGSGGRG